LRAARDAPFFLALVLRFAAAFAFAGARRVRFS
jgi:hypothetical protein